MQHNLRYTLLFAGAVCIVCSILVSSAAVQLRERQEENAVLDRQKKVLAIAGLLPTGKVSREQVKALFTKNIRSRVVDLQTGAYVPSIDPETYDQKKASEDPQTSRPAPPNAAQVRRLPKNAVVFEVVDGQDEVQSVILPVEGKGLWSTLYGYFALQNDLMTIKGITFYEHGETPGLGGEVDNPKWKALWPGRKAFDSNWQPQITVVKGQAGSVATAPYQVDGLSGATLTSRGVTNLVHFWLGEHGFRPFLQKFKAREG